MKCKEDKEIALEVEGLINVNTDAGHKGVESTALGTDSDLALEN